MSLISRKRVTSQHHYTRRKKAIEPRFINGVNLALVKSSLFHNFQSKPGVLFSQLILLFMAAEKGLTAELLLQKKPGQRIQRKLEKAATCD